MFAFPKHFRWSLRTSSLANNIDLELGQQRYPFLVQQGGLISVKNYNKFVSFFIVLSLFAFHYFIFHDTLYHHTTTTHEITSQESSLPQNYQIYKHPQQTTPQPIMVKKVVPPKPIRSLPRIDIVYSYVNGSDPERLKAKIENLRLEQKNPSSNVDLQTVADIGLARDNNELLYSLRSVKQYLPWFNGIIHIVTDQVPNWLNVSHPQIRVIQTRDFIPQIHLPTFNSHAIEANLHHIPGLAEYFLYFNDDYLIGATVPQSYYMNFKNKDNDEVCLVFYHDDRKTIRSDEVQKGQSIHYQAMKNVNRMLDQKFGSRDRFYLPHAPHLFRRSGLAQIEKTFLGEFEQTSRNKFRSWTDIHSAYLFANYLVENPSHCATFKKMRNKCYFNNDYCIKLLTGLEDSKLFFHKIKTAKRQWKFMSINDHVPDSSADTDKIMQLFQEYLQWKYPFPSPWERL